MRIINEVVAIVALILSILTIIEKSITIHDRIKQHKKSKATPKRSHKRKRK